MAWHCRTGRRYCDRGGTAIPLCISTGWPKMVQGRSDNALLVFLTGRLYARQNPNAQ